MPKAMEPREILSLANPNKGWVINELDNLREEWIRWLEVAQALPISADYDPRTCTEAIKGGFANRRKHEVLREKL